MCHLSVKLSNTSDQIPLVLLTEQEENNSNKKHSWLDLESKGQGKKSKDNAPGSNKHAIHQTMSRILPIIDVQLICEIFYISPTYNHRKRSTMVKSHQVNFRFLASRNQVQLIIFEPSELGHRIGSFSTTQYMQK